MSEMSEGAKAAWERWRQEQYQQFSGSDAEFIMAINGKDVAYAAGFAACLAALEGYKTHLQERADEFKRAGDTNSAHAFMNFSHEVVNAEMWIKAGITCNLPDHTRCQEANQR